MVGSDCVTAKDAIHSTYPGHFERHFNKAIEAIGFFGLNPKTSPVSTEEYIIEYRWDGRYGTGFARSGNEATCGVFTDIKLAEQTAAKEQEAMGPGYTYRVVPKGN